MRVVLLACAIVIAALVADTQPGSAQFFNNRYCALGGSDESSGEPDCSFNTWEQCRASASGLARYCSENPNWRPRQDQRPQRTTRQQRSNN